MLLRVFLFIFFIHKRAIQTITGTYSQNPSDMTVASLLSTIFIPSIYSNHMQECGRLIIEFYMIKW